MKISLVSIFVDDPKKAFQFYTEKLGFSEHTYMPEADLAIVVSPEEPEGTALLLEPRGDSFAKNYQLQVYKAGLPIIVFGVMDIEADYKILTEKGVKFIGRPEKTDWGIQALLEDTCGNLVQLHQK